MDTFTRWTIPSLQLEKYFDHIINSADTGEYKTDNAGASFLREIKKQNVEARECILLDDSNSAIEVFAELGGIAYHVSKEKPVERYLSCLMKEKGLEAIV